MPYWNHKLDTESIGLIANVSRQLEAIQPPTLSCQASPTCLLQGRIGIYDTNKEERPLSAQLGLAAPASAPPVMEHFNSFLEVPIMAARTIGGKYATISEDSDKTPHIDI